MLKTYAYHKPSTEGLEKITELRKLFSDLTEQVIALTPGSREKSIALTELETAAMWAIKAIVCNDPGSVAEGIQLVAVLAPLRTDQGEL